MSEVLNKDELIKKYEEQRKKDRNQKIFLLLIIIILLVSWVVTYRLGKIGYEETSTLPDNENIKLIKITDKNGEIGQNTQLNIFENKKFNDKKIIAPKSKGEYTFCIKNISDKDISYNINFIDQMENKINMKYKLKLDNSYIKGNAENYIDINNLNLEEIVAQKDSINVFTLEWYWEDDDKNDTIVGSKLSNEYYTLNLEITAEEYNK